MKLNFETEIATPQLLLAWACAAFEKICIAVSFGKDSVTLLHMLRSIKPDIDVIFLETGYDFPETLEFIKRLKGRWKMNIRIFKNDLSISEYAKIVPDDLAEIDPVRCCHIHKVLPMSRALEDYDAWITGLRRDESEFRKDIKPVEFKDGLTKINPLANWSEIDVWTYIRKNGVPYNPLYDRGYRSLGCGPCTLSGRLGRFERAGRWVGTELEGGECGLHTEL